MSRLSSAALAVLAAALAIQGPAACSRLPSETRDAAEPVKPLDRIQVTERADRVRVELETGGPVAYSMSTNRQPPTVTVELPGLSKGAALDLGEINKPPVLRVVSTEVASPRPGLHVVFYLTSLVEPEVRAEGARLLLDFPKPVTTAAGSSDSLAASDKAPVGKPEEPVSVAAKTMTKVEVRRAEGELRVILLGDGAFTYDARLLGLDRLVVDLANIETPLRFQLLPVDHPLLKQIRIGQHSRRVRLVLDLPTPIDYAIEPGADSLVIRLTGLTDRLAAGATKRAKPDGGDSAGSEADAGPKDGRVRVEPSGPVPLPDRLARVEGALPRAQMAPAPKGSVEAEEGERPRYTGRRISLDFQGADITNVLRLIAEVSGFNIVVGEGVKAKVTMKMINVPWDQALDMLLKMNNLGRIREGNIVWIDTLANIAKQQEEEAKAKESKIKAEDLVTRVVYVQNVSAQDIQRSLLNYLSPRGQLTFNAASNALIIKDTESQITSLVQLVRSLDLEVPQVQIEARIVQADTTYARSLGIQWGVSSLQTGSSGVVTNIRGQGGGLQTPNPFGGQTSQFLVNLPASISGLSAVPGLGFTWGKLTGDGALLDMRLTAGENLGLAKVVAAPKILTLDKQQAKIEQGSSIPYQTTSLQGTQTTFVDAVLSLQVTPQITSRDPKEMGKQILLKIKATRNALGASNTPAGPSIDKREAQTQILVRDGETAVIGGIFQDQVQSTVIGIPWLSRIPVLGWLFKSKQETTTKNELLIFLTPTIIRS